MRASISGPRKYLPIGNFGRAMIYFWAFDGCSSTALKLIPKSRSLTSMYRIAKSVPVIYRLTSVEIIQWLRGSMNTKHLIWMLSHTGHYKTFPLYDSPPFSIHAHERDAPRQKNMRGMAAGWHFHKNCGIDPKNWLSQNHKKLQTSPPWPSLPVLSIQARGLSPLPPFGWVEAKLLPPLLLPPNTYLPSSWRHQPWYEFSL